MNERKILMQLEYEWRAFRLYRKMINRLVKMHLKLTSPLLCFLDKKLDKHEIRITKLKCIYEKETGKTIVFYKSNEY